MWCAVGVVLLHFYRQERMEESKAASFLRISEWLAILAMVYSAGVASIQISRYGPRLDINVAPAIPPIPKPALITLENFCFVQCGIHFLTRSP